MSDLNEYTEVRLGPGLGMGLVGRMQVLLDGRSSEVFGSAIDLSLRYLLRRVSALNSENSLHSLSCSPSHQKRGHSQDDTWRCRLDGGRRFPAQLSCRAHAVYWMDLEKNRVSCVFLTGRGLTPFCSPESPPRCRLALRSAKGVQSAGRACVQRAGGRRAGGRRAQRHGNHC